MANTYTDTPHGGDIIANTQPTIEANFNYLTNTLGSAQTFKAGGTGPGDHQISIGGIDSNQFEGRHLSVSFKNQAGNLAYPNDGVDSYMWSNAGDIYCGNATAGPFKLTAMSTATGFGALGTTSTTTPTAGAVASTNAGWIFLPGGLILQYGQISSPSSSGKVNYPRAFPNNVLGVFFNIGSNLNITTTIINTSGTNTLGTFSFLGTSSTPAIFYWIAIGN